MRAIRHVPAALGNYSRGRKHRIDTLVIHVMEGGFEPTGVWFATPDARASAHYGVSVDGDVAQYVLDADTAWHAGNAEYNARSVGIELEGHCSDPDAFTPAMLDSLVELADGLCCQHGIVKDRVHIIGHNEVPDPRHPDQRGGAGHHFDPGQYFQWERFMEALTRRVA
jgi:N-acetyl-anhydromuramyl-L-alanine amidase AmpD